MIVQRVLDKKKKHLKASFITARLTKTQYRAAAKFEAEKNPQLAIQTPFV